MPDDKNAATRAALREELNRLTDECPDDQLPAGVVPASGPLAAVAIAYTQLDDEAKKFMDDCLSVVVGLELPRMLVLRRRGKLMPIADRKPLADCFKDGLSQADEKNSAMSRELTATLRDAGTEIAESIDKAVRRVVLDSKKVVALPVHELMSFHVRIMRALVDLTKTTED